MKRAESYYHMAADVRRDVANILFNPDTVARAIHEVASLGHRHYRIVQEHPFDLSDTDSAHALEEWWTRRSSTTSGDRRSLSKTRSGRLS